MESCVSEPSWQLIRATWPVLAHRLRWVVTRAISQFLCHFSIPHYTLRWRQQKASVDEKAEPPLGENPPWKLPGALLSSSRLNNYRWLSHWYFPIICYCVMRQLTLTSPWSSLSGRETQYLSIPQESQSNSQEHWMVFTLTSPINITVSFHVA